MRVLVIPQGLLPTAVIGVIRPLSALRAAVELRVRLPREWRSEDVRWADVVVFSRNHDASSLAALRMARQIGKPTVYEIDDSYFDIPAGIPGLTNYRDPALLVRVLEFLCDATRVHAYSDYVAEAIRTLGVPCDRPPTYFDDALRVDRAALSSAERWGPPRIVLPTSRGDTPPVRAFTDELLRAILASFAHVEVHVWRDPGPLRSHPRLIWHAVEPEYSRFIASLAGLDAWVGLAVLGDSPLELSKTNNKFREFGGLGIPAIYSDVPVYSGCVIDGENGLLRRNVTSEWTRAIGQLLESRSDRARIASNAWASVEQTYSLDASKEFWVRTLQSLPAGDARPQEPGVRGVVPIVRPSSRRDRRSAANYLSAAARATSATTIPWRDDWRDGVLVLVEVSGQKDLRALQGTDLGGAVIDATSADQETLAAILAGCGPSGCVLVPSHIQGDESAAHPWLPDRFTAGNGITAVRTQARQVAPLDGPHSWSFAVAYGMWLVARGRGTYIDHRTRARFPRDLVSALVRMDDARLTMSIVLARGRRIAQSPPRIWLPILKGRMSRKYRRIRRRTAESN